MDAKELFDKHAAMVYNLALRLSGNAADAQDISQDAFIRAIRGLGGLRDGSIAGTWLYRITMNVWKNRVRSEKRRSFWKTFSLDREKEDENDQNALQIASPEPPADAAIEERDEKEALEKALAALDPEDRAILVLREIDGRSYEEIAGITEIPLGTVKSRISRSREALRQKMGSLLKDNGT
ncbi:MAG: sigma-70 family RNA polymerase sigma factor [Elusimicrobiales bacterium]|nr:sigma-70 family RNA polymerase sigma factor [Elusimicrobiales bacterium]